VKILSTWGKRSKFSYGGNVKKGTRILFGKGRWEEYVSAKHYQNLLDHFRNKTVPCGTSRDNPPEGSLGEWLKQNVTKRAIASYVGSILIHEGYATKIGSDISFKG
jgi:hypothetical protein